MRPYAIIRLRLPHGGDRCDFCGFPAVEKLYACKNFQWWGRDIFRSGRGRWASCYSCGLLVDNANWDMLVARVMKEVKRRAGMTPEDSRRLRKEVKGLYALVRENIQRSEALTVHQVRVRLVDSVQM